MLEARIVRSPPAFRRWLEELDPSEQTARLLTLRRGLQERAAAEPGLVRDVLANTILPSLPGNDAALRLSFELLLAGLMDDAGARFAATIAMAGQAGLEGLVAAGFAEWASWFAARADWPHAEQYFARAQDRFHAIGRSDKAAELYPVRASVLAHLMDYPALQKATAGWLAKPLPAPIAVGILLQCAYSAIDVDCSAAADRHLRDAEALAQSPGAAAEPGRVWLARAAWYWRFGAYSRAAELLSAEATRLQSAGAAWQAELVAANLFSLRVMVQGHVTSPAERERFEQLRPRLRHEALAPWWQLSLDLAVAAERGGDVASAVRIYAELEQAPPPRPFELKLAGLNFARLRVGNGFLDGLDDDLSEARRDPYIQQHPYLRMLAFETSAMHAERSGYLRQAAEMLDTALAALEQRRQDTPWEHLRLGLRGARQALFQRHEAAFLALGDHTAAWRAADQARAATFADVLGGGLAPLERRGLGGILQQRAALGRALRARDRDDAVISRLELLLDRAVAEAPRRLTGTSPAGQQQQPVITGTTAFLCYSLTQLGLGAYVVRAAHISHHPLLGTDASADLLRMISQWWQRQAGDDQADEPAWQADTTAWSAALIEPLLDQLAGIDQLGVVPYDALTLLPWPGLWLPSRQCYLDELFPAGLFVLPSCATAALLATYKPAAPRGGIACVRAGSGLAYAQLEAGTVAAALGPSVRRLDQDLVEAWQLRCLLPQTAWLHLIGHGEFRSDLPMASAFLLGGGERWTSWDLVACQMPASTVVLSACTLGGIQNLPGGEWFGLLRGFIVAGARSIVAPLWPVRDLLALVLMSAFYSYLSAPAAPLGPSLHRARQSARAWARAARSGESGLPPHAATVLDRAFSHWSRATVAGRHANAAQQEMQRAALTDELSRLAHPRHWSVFQLYGDPARTAPVPSPGSQWPAQCP